MKLFAILLSVFIISCSFSRKTHEDYDDILGEENLCTKKYFETDENIFESIQRVSTEGAGHIISYTLVGGAYGGEIAVRFIGGIAVGVIVCSPVLLVEGSLPGSGQASGRCIGEVGGHIVGDDDLKWGNSTYKETEGLRCPEVNHISQGVRRIAQCHLDNKEYQQSYDQLMTLLLEKEILRCISKSEKKKLNKLLKLSKKTNATKSKVQN